MAITAASKVLEHGFAAPEDAHAFFATRLAHETDPSDVYADLRAAPSGDPPFAVVDTRGRDAYAEGHLPGALSLPHDEITPAIADWLSKDRLIVTYCWSISCNAGVKGAAKLAALGYRVKEMIGGISAWRAEGYPVEAATTAAETEAGSYTRSSTVVN